MKKLGNTIQPKQTDEELLELMQTSLHPEQLISYKELTTLLNIPYKGGKGKIVQLENLERFMEYIYDKDTKKYLIVSINDTPIPKQPRKRRSDAIYINYVEKSIRMNLLKRLTNTTDTSIMLSKKNWWEVIGIINEMYCIYYNYDRRQELLNNNLLPKHLDKINIDEFFYRTYLRFNTIFTKCLQRLKDELLISYDDDMYSLSIDRDHPWNSHLATFKERSNIKTCEKTALNELGYKAMSQLYLHPDQLSTFYHRAAIYEKEYGYLNVSKGILIIPEKTFLPKEYKFSIEEYETARQEVNKVFRDNNDTYIHNHYEKNKICFFDDAGSMNWDASFGLIRDKNRLHPIIKYYNENQLALSDYLLNII